MTIELELIDSEGFDWDFSGADGLNVVDGQDDTFDNGMRLVVNGQMVSPQQASLDLDGREINAQPVLIDGVAVQRSIYVSSADGSDKGFARFLESFTNTTDQTISITVQTVTNSGADSGLQFTGDSGGDGTVSDDDTAFTVDDGDPVDGDSAFVQAFGDGTGSSDITVIDDTITVTRTLTLAPGETQSILQFATQNTSTANASPDLQIFTGSAADLDAAGALAGLSREEQLSIVNYSGFDTLNDPLSLRDSDGNLWTIGTDGTISSATGAITDFTLTSFSDSFTTVESVSMDTEAHEVTVVKSGLASNPGATVTYDYKALDDLGVIRLLVTFQNDGVAGHLFDGFAIEATGPDGTTLVAQNLTGPDGQTIGVVIDDSASGSGSSGPGNGVPAATVVWGSITPGDAFSINGNLVATQQGSFTIGPQQQVTFVYFLAVNDTGLAALADLTSLAAPDPRLLQGLSAIEVANLLNFQIDEFGGRLQEVLGQADVDDVITGHAWGDSILGDSGDDDISALGSDDIVRGGSGEDIVDGGDGADSLFGGVGNDDLSGGTGNDRLFGEDDNDQMAGQAGDDGMFGGNGQDRMIGASGTDTLSGLDGQDTLFGNIGNDVLQGQNGIDDLYGGANDDLIFGGAEFDLLFGGKGKDTLNGDDGTDGLDGGDGNDLMFGGLNDDSVVGDLGSDTLNGDDGNDSLDGGEGVDSLIGGLNDDALFGGNKGDVLFGGRGADSLTGGAATDTGINQLFGGQDGDTYFITSTRDQVTEAGDTTGEDRVFSTVSYALTDNVESLTLTGTAANGVGNAGANRLTGNAEDNQLDGLGGNDTMTGNRGNDTYIVADGGDVVVEATGGVGGGTDTVIASVTFTLGQNVENLTLQGATAIDGTGNNLSNTIIGNNAVNTLTGGLGSDTLTGSGGKDVFVFNTVPSLNNIDHITDFAANGERVYLDATIFTGLDIGRPGGATFVYGSAAQDENDRLIYDIDTGTLRYDADGSGAIGARFIAVFDNHALLTNSNFFVL